MKKDYYKILGVDKNSSTEDIKKAYRTLSKTHHPDMGGDGEKFKEINEAYGVLGEPQKRQQYDSPPQRGFRIEDFFEGFGFSQPGSGFGGFGGFNNGSPFQQQIYEQLDMQFTQRISMQDIYMDKRVSIDFDKDVLCTRCDGLGVIPGPDSTECLHCEGKGQVHGHRCNYCNASGEIHTNQCEVCKGEKVVNKKETVNIDNVFVLQQTQQVSYRGMGHASRQQRGRNGDVHVTLVPEMLPNYERQGANLLYKMKVNFLDAIAGSATEYIHLDGKKLNVKIPAKINNGHKLKLTGQGMLQQDKRSRGDLIIQVELTIDYNTFDASKLDEIRK